jgi:hypothetical protein
MSGWGRGRAGQNVGRRRALLAAAVLVAVVLWWGAPAFALPAQQPGDEGDSTTSSVTAPPDQDIIPEPNSGHPPTEAGDRGGALQLALLALIVAGVGFVAWRIIVSARRHEARREETRRHEAERHQARSDSQP